MRCQGNAWRRCQLRPESSDNESKAETLQKYKTISKNQEDVRRQQTERSQGMQRIPTWNQKQVPQLLGEENNISKNWTQVKEIYYETAEKKILDLKTMKYKDWLNTETYKAIDERRKLKEEIGRSN